MDDRGNVDLSINFTGAPGQVTSASVAFKGIIQLTNDLSGTATSPEVVSTHLSTPLPISQGGTGSSSQDFVDLSSSQPSIGGAKTFMSALTPSGGITPTISGFTAFGVGGQIDILNTTSGASTAMVAGSIYYGAALIPYNCVLTGIMATVGGTGGTDSWIGALYDSGGTLVANSITSGMTVAAANTKMNMPFTSTCNVVGPAVYYIAIQSNGNTAKFQALNNTLEGFVTGSATGVFGVLPSIAPGTSYTQAAAPFANTY